jgi:hypothetical protein
MCMKLFHSAVEYNAIKVPARLANSLQSIIRPNEYLPFQNETNIGSSTF